MPKCKSCGAEILWVEMIDTGKKMPVDMPLRSAVVVDSTRTKGAVRKVGISHFSTCPSADQHRKEKS